MVVLAGVVPVPFGGLFLPHPEPFCHPRDAPHGRFAAAPRRRWARGRGRVSSRPTGSFRHALCRTTRCPRGLKTRLASYVKPSREVLLAHLRQISALLDRHSQPSGVSSQGAGNEWERAAYPTGERLLNRQPRNRGPAGDGVAGTGIKGLLGRAERLQFVAGPKTSSSRLASICLLYTSRCV